jgi:hypothetical protein
MAYTLLPTQKPSDTDDFALGAIDSANGNMFRNTGRELIVVANASGNSRNMTVHGVADEYGRSGTRVITIPDGKQRLVGPFAPTRIWNQPTGDDKGKTYITWSGAGPTIAVIGP